jgi:hypothetical protein
LSFNNKHFLQPIFFALVNRLIRFPVKFSLILQLLHSVVHIQINLHDNQPLFIHSPFPSIHVQCLSQFILISLPPPPTPIIQLHIYINNFLYIFNLCIQKKSQFVFCPFPFGWAAAPSIPSSFRNVLSNFFVFYSKLLPFRW